VPADLADRLDDQLPDASGDLDQLVVGEVVQVGGAVDAVQEWGS